MIKAIMTWLRTSSASPVALLTATPKAPMSDDRLTTEGQDQGSLGRDPARQGHHAVHGSYEEVK